MRIGIFFDVFYPYLAGGAENRSWQLARQFVSHGDEVLVVTSRLAGCPRYEALLEGKLEIYRVGFPSHPMTRRSTATLPGYAASLTLNGRLVEECDILDLNPYTGAIAGRLVSVLKKKPKVVTVHDLFIGQWSFEHDLASSILGTMAERLVGLVNSQGSFITVSAATKKRIIECLGIDADHIHVVPNGVDFEGIRKITEHIRKDTNRVVYVGRLVRHKNVEQVIKLVSELRKLGFDVKADIVGDGSEREKLEAFSSALHLSGQVRFWGFIPQKQVAKLVSLATVFVNPSFVEGFGLTLLEAMAAGTPVVAYDLEAYREYARDEQNCLLAPGYDFEQLLDRAARILSDPVTTNQISRSGIETARQFGWDKTAEKVRSVYSSIAS
jgi:glycosyltransferase involved in cell wall biosynthesis